MNLTAKVGGILVAVMAWSVALAQVPVQPADPTKPVSCEPGNLSEVQPETSKDAGDFLRALQTALKSNDKDAAADLFTYPFTVHMKSTKLVVRNKDQFVQKYDRIFPKELVNLVERQQTACLNRVGDKGFMLGRGEIWFDKFPDGKVEAFSVNLIFY